MRANATAALLPVLVPLTIITITKINKNEKKKMEKIVNTRVEKKKQQTHTAKAIKVQQQ